MLAFNFSNSFSYCWPMHQSGLKFYIHEKNQEEHTFCGEFSLLLLRPIFLFVRQKQRTERCVKILLQLLSSFFLGGGGVLILLSITQFRSNNLFHQLWLKTIMRAYLKKVSQRFPISGDLFSSFFHFIHSFFLFFKKKSAVPFHAVLENVQSFPSVL